MIVKFLAGKVFITKLFPYCIPDPVDDLMFILMPYGVNEQTNRFFNKGKELFEYEDLNWADEIWLCFDPTIQLSRQDRKSIVRTVVKLVFS